MLLEPRYLPVAGPSRIGAIVLVAFALVEIGCYPIGSESRIVGVYELNAGEARIVLAIRRDHTFVETITDAGVDNGQRSGTWRWTGALDMDSLWIPPVFAPSYILQTDTRSEPGKFKYTRPGHWSLGPEWHFGRVVLPIFPADDIEFRMVRRG